MPSINHKFSDNLRILHTFQWFILVQVTALSPTQIPVHCVKVMLSLCTPCRRTFGGEIELHSFLTSALNVSGQFQALAALPPE